MHLWRSKYSPFIRQAQYDFGRRLIVMPLTTFHRLADMIGDPQGELIFLFNTARCGSTLLTQVCYTLFHRRTRASYVYNGCLAWYNVVLTRQVHSSVKFVGLPLGTHAMVE